MELNSILVGNQQDILILRELCAAHGSVVPATSLYTQRSGTGLYGNHFVVASYILCFSCYVCFNVQSKSDGPSLQFLTEDVK